MKSLISCIASFMLMAGLAVGQNVGIGTTNPLSRLDVNGNLTVGSGWAGTLTAGTDGAIIQGNLGVGDSVPAMRLSIYGGQKVRVPSSSFIYRRIYDDTDQDRVREKVNYTGSYTEVDLDVVAPINTGIARYRIFRHTNTSGEKAMYFMRGDSSTASSARIAVDGVDSYFQIHGGRLGIATNAPTSTLSVNGTADKPGGGAWAVFSDARLKKDIHPFMDGLALVQQIKPVTYHYDGRFNLDEKPEYVGILAQDIQKLAPYMVSEVELSSAEGEKTPFLRYDGSAMDFILINAVKELSEQNAQLKKELDELKRLNGMPVGTAENR